MKGRPRRRSEPHTLSAGKCFVWQLSGRGKSPTAARLRGSSSRSSVSCHLDHIRRVSENNAIWTDLSLGGISWELTSRRRKNTTTPAKDAQMHNRKRTNTWHDSLVIKKISRQNMPHATRKSAIPSPYLCGPSSLPTRFPPICDAMYHNSFVYRRVLPCQGLLRTGST